MAFLNYYKNGKFMSFEFVSLNIFGRLQLAGQLILDKTETKYGIKGTNALIERITTDEKISGVVVKASNSDRNIIFGFGLYNENEGKITDMFIFTQGRKDHFVHIAKHYLDKGWKGEFLYDEFNAPMKDIFESQAKKAKEL